MNNALMDELRHLVGAANLLTEDLDNSGVSACTGREEDSFMFNELGSDPHYVQFRGQIS